MDQSEIDRLIQFNEPESGEEQRVLFEFAGSKHLVVLLNEFYPDIRSQFAQLCPALTGQFAKTGNAYELELPHEILFHLPEGEKLPPLSAWALGTDGKKLVVPTMDLANEIDGRRFVPFGMVITGKSAIGSVIETVRMLKKTEPTPFVSDEFGDSYNNSFYKEPRLIESAPQTVFNIIEDLMAIAKRLFQAQNYAAAAKKYQKAFHYAHSYYPEHLDAEHLASLTDYKTRSLLNLAIASNKTGDYKKAVEAADFVLEMPETADRPLILAKAYYQLGTASLGQGDEVRAKDYYGKSNEAHPDNATLQAISDCKKRAMERRSREGTSLRAAFSTP